MNFNIDLKDTEGRLNTPWNFGVNTCHAILWTRDDLNRHAKTAARECGFRYVRFHNTISKHTGIYTEDGEGNPVINFEKFDAVFDNVAACGYLPFFEIGFCPDALSNHTRDLCYYEADPSVPKSFKKWSYLISEIVRHCIDRYGLEYVKKWYFEVWNEPDLFYDGTMEDYFTLYDHTVCAVKSVCPDLRVGGPATSKCLWIDEFIRHIESGSEITDFKPVACDFISTHAYPSDVAFLDSDIGDVELLDSDIMRTLFARVRDAMDKSSLRGKPLFMGEWNSSAGPFAANHDEKNNCAYIIKICHDVKDIIDGSLFWNLSDIYEEQGFHYVPFHGGYGLININDIKKSSFHAFKMLNELCGDELRVKSDGGNPGIGALAAYDRKRSEVNAVVYYYCEPGTENGGVQTVTLNISSVKAETVPLTVQGVTDESGSAYEWWIKSASPQFANKALLALLEEKSQLTEDSKVLFKDKEGNFTANLSLNPGDSLLVKFKV